MNVEKSNKVWFTSDTHFGAQRTLDMSKRPFKSVEEMDKTIIDNWNSVVGEFDTVFHLGDFGDYKVADKLNGKIILICGNYERNDVENLYLNEEYFHMIYTDRCNHWIWHVEDNFTYRYNVRMAHEPSFLRNNDITDYHINLFGHVHKLCMVKSFGLNVGMDCHNFYPIDMETVLFYHNAILRYYDDDVFE